MGVEASWLFPLLLLSDLAPLESATLSDEGTQERILAS